MLRKRLDGLLRRLAGSPRTHTFLAALIAICLVVALTVRQLAHERGQALQSLIRDNQSRVQSFEQYVLRTLEVADVATRHIDYLASRSQLPASPQILETDQALRSPLFTAVLINRGASGESSTNPRIRVSAQTQAHLLQIAQKAAGELAVTAPLPLLGVEPQVAVVRRLPTVKDGFVAIFIDPHRFTQFADDIEFADADLISLIGLDGVTRARRTGSRHSAGEVVRGLVMERQLADPNGTYLGPSVLDGIPRYFSHRRLTRFDLFVTSGMPATLVNHGIAQRRRAQFGIMTAAILVILGAAALLLITIRRREERLKQLQLSIGRLNEAQRLGSVGDWDYYPATDELHWSENLRRMYGRADDESVSRLREVARYTKDRESLRVEREFRRVLDTGEPATWEIDVILGSGEQSTRRVMAAPIRNEHGSVIGLHGTDQDITQEAKVRSLENRLAELARLDSMRALAATFAHELNQPLGVAANYLGAASRVLSGSSRADPKVLGYLESTRKQIDYIGQIIDGARALVTGSGSNAQEVVVAEVIDSVVMLLRASDGGRSTQFKIKATRGAEVIRVNVTQLKQVLFNLCRNAIEAVPTTRTPSIEFLVSLNSEGMVQFEITDNGGGFPQSDSDPFATLSTTKKNGLGLGLSLSRTIVEAQGGKIWIERTDPDGTTLAFTLQTGDVADRPFILD